MMNVNIDEQLIQKIDDFLTGKLSAEEVQQFEAELTADSELQELVEFQRIEREGIEFLIGQDLKAKLKTWAQTPPDVLPIQIPSDPKNKKPIYKIGFLLLFLVFTIFFLWRWFDPSEPTTIEPTQVPKTETEIPKVQPTESSIKQKANTPIATVSEPEKAASEKQNNPYEGIAIAAYETPSAFDGMQIRGEEEMERHVLTSVEELLSVNPPQYSKAIRLLSSIPSSDTIIYEQAQYLLGHLYFNTKKYKKATALFEGEMTKDLSPSEKDEIEWYYVLSQLAADGRNTKVDKLLQKMIDPASAHEFASKAKIILKKLDKTPIQ